MSHERMARGSTVAATLPVVTASPSPQRSGQPLLRWRLARSPPLYGTHSLGHDARAGTGSGEDDDFPTSTRIQRFSTLILHHRPRAVSRGARSYAHHGRWTATWALFHSNPL